MRIYIVRHADAHPVGAKGIKSDEERFLTGKGKKRSRRLGRALSKTWVKADWIWTSPLVRSKQTAELLSKGLRAHPPVMDLEELAPPGRGPALLKALAEKDPRETVVVGHEPFLGRFLGRLLTGDAGAAMPLSKASVACVETDEIKWGSGRLMWLITPVLIKSIAK